MSPPINEKYIKGPFRADENGGYVFGPPGNFMFAQVRGWGTLQYGPDAAKTQDANLRSMVDSLNEKVARDAPGGALRAGDLLRINDNRNARIVALEIDLEWLRFFKSRVYHALGPADEDIVNSIRREYKLSGKELPKEELEALLGV